MRKPTAEEAQAVDASLAAWSLQRCQISRWTDKALHIQFVTQRRLHDPEQQLLTFSAWFSTGQSPSSNFPPYNFSDVLRNPT